MGAKRKFDKGETMKSRKVVNAVLVAVIFISFFLPWVRVEAPMVGSIAKVLTGKRQAEITSISGFDVPILANGPDARLMISIIKIFDPDVKDADKKSWLIWGVPLFAIIIFLLDLLLKGNRWFYLGVALIGILIFFGAVYKIKTTDLDKLVLNAKIGVGLWLTLYGYLGLGVFAAMGFIRSLANNPKK
jgi:hypothetical protein